VFYKCLQNSPGFLTQCSQQLSWSGALTGTQRNMLDEYLFFITERAACLEGILRTGSRIGFQQIILDCLDVLHLSIMKDGQSYLKSSWNLGILRWDFYSVLVFVKHLLCKVFISEIIEWCKCNIWMASSLFFFRFSSWKIELWHFLVLLFIKIWRHIKFGVRYKYTRCKPKSTVNPKCQV